MLAQTTAIGITINSPVTWFVIAVVGIVLALTVSTRRNATRARPAAATERTDPAEWAAVESLFLDEPRAALVAAQALVTRVRRRRPGTEPGAASDDERYDRACAVATDERATTEEMREALLAFRAIFNAR